MSGHDYDAVNYWKANLRLIFGSLIVWALVSYGFAILLRPMLAGIPIGGTDLGFWFAQQGSIYIFIALIIFYVVRMKKLERKYDLDD